MKAREPDLAAIKRRQRALSRAKKGSRSRAKKRLAVAKAWRREIERARNADYRLAHRLVTDHDGIGVEALNVAGMLRSRSSSKTMSERRWSTLDAILEHKAVKAGVPICGGQRRVHQHPLLAVWASPADAHRQTCLRLRAVWNGVMPRRQRCQKHMRPSLPKARWPAGEGGNFPRCSAHHNFCQGDRPPPRGATRADATEQYALSVNSGI